jgi:hypothetical protein
MTASRKTGNTEIGYGKPPVTTRFHKGKRGNPRGRPPGRNTGAPYDAVLGQMVTIREDGVERRVTAAEALLLQITKKGLEGNPAARPACNGGVRGGPGTAAPKKWTSHKVDRTSHR